MLKQLGFVVACAVAALGCDNKQNVATAEPAQTVAETPKASTTPTKAETPIEDGKWVTIKGKIVWDKAKGAAPVRTPIKATKDEDVAAKDKDFNTEEWVVNPKGGGIKNAVIWLAPEPTEDELKGLKDKTLKTFPSFKATDIHATLAKPEKASVEIDQPCCRFIPHVVLARAGQDMIIKNSAPVPHNAKWTSRDNGEFNPLIPAGGQFKIPAPLVAEKYPIDLACSIHPWMKAMVRVFDHPYFALTDDEGNFEIKNAPVLKGKLRIFIFHETGGIQGGAEGRFGQTLEVKPGSMDLKEIKFSDGK
jgi:hypothetical protein